MLCINHFKNIVMCNPYEHHSIDLRYKMTNNKHGTVHDSYFIF